jgi:hypothetical protein
MDVSSGFANLDRVMRRLGLFASASSERNSLPPGVEEWVSVPHLCPFNDPRRRFHRWPLIDESGGAVR